MPKDVEVIVTRDYGETANEKANELLFHLGLATLSIVLLMGIVIGWREGLVVLIVIPTTILLTLFASYFMGYTINRVSLFALIFSIGILVDDAIVVIENIARHWAMADGRSRTQAAIEAVAEVGNPTIVATLTVVAALLPMLFVSGLMGPYMAPIPTNASSAMMLSFFVAVVVTPWLMLRLAGGGSGHASGNHAQMAVGLAKPMFGLRDQSSPHARRRGGFLALSARRRSRSLLLFATKSVTVKLLPFDNKSELQVVVDLPRGTSLEETDRVLLVAAAEARRSEGAVLDSVLCRDCRTIQLQRPRASFIFEVGSGAGRPADQPHAGKDRKRTSHDIALDVRQRLKGLTLPPGNVGQGRRGAARATCARNPAGRDLWSGPGHATRRCPRGSQAVPKRALCCR